MAGWVITVARRYHSVGFAESFANRIAAVSDPAATLTTAAF
jgi:hypothetical protein